MAKLEIRSGRARGAESVKSYWAKSMHGEYWLIVYWHPKLKLGVMVKVFEQPTAGERLW